MILNEEFSAGEWNAVEPEVEPLPAEETKPKPFNFTTTTNQERLNDLDRKQEELLEGKQTTKT